MSGPVDALIHARFAVSGGQRYDTHGLAFFVVFTALVFWAAIFSIFFTSQGTSALEFLLGRYEAPPDHLNTWRDLEIEQPSGLLRQERLLFPAGRQSGPILLRQVRYRDPISNAIVRVAPEERVRRRRVSARANGGEG